MDATWTAEHLPQLCDPSSYPKTNLQQHQSNTHSSSLGTKRQTQVTRQDETEGRRAVLVGRIVGGYQRCCLSVFWLSALSVSVVGRAEEEEGERKREVTSIYHFDLFGVGFVQLMHHQYKVDYIG